MVPKASEISLLHIGGVVGVVEATISPVCNSVTFPKLFRLFVKNYNILLTHTEAQNDYDTLVSCNKVDNDKL